MKDLERKIEGLREEMHNMYLANPQNPQLITISQSLDELLNEYGRQTKK